MSDISPRYPIVEDQLTFMYIEKSSTFDAVAVDERDSFTNVAICRFHDDQIKFSGMAYNIWARVYWSINYYGLRFNISKPTTAKQLAFFDAREFCHQSNSDLWIPYSISDFENDKILNLLRTSGKGLPC